MIKDSEGRNWLCEFPSPWGEKGACTAAWSAAPGGADTPAQKRENTKSSAACTLLDGPKWKPVRDWKSACSLCCL